MKIRPVALVSGIIFSLLMAGAFPVPAQEANASALAKKSPIPANTVAAGEGIKRIQTHIETINQRFKPMDAKYNFYGAPQTMLDAIRLNGAQGEIDAGNSGNGLYLTWDVVSAFYTVHRGALEDSIYDIKITKKMAPVDRKKLDYLDRGMTAWHAKDKEVQFRFDGYVDTKAKIEVATSAWKEASQHSNDSVSANARYEETRAQYYHLNEIAEMLMTPLRDIGYKTRLFSAITATDPVAVPEVPPEVVKTGDYHIASLDISYAAWDAAQTVLRTKLGVAEDDVRHAEEQLRQENAAYDLRREHTATRHRALVAAEATQKAAEQAAVNYAPADSAKTNAYRQLEESRNRLARRVDTLYAGIIAITGDGNVVEPAAFENYKRLDAELDHLNANLATLDTELGFSRERERLRQAASEAFVATISAERELNAAVTVQDQARAREDNAELSLSEARAKLSAVEQELARFTETAPRIGGVTAEDGAVMKYETVFWDPSDVLEFLDGEIAELGRVLAQSSKARRELREQFLESHATATFHQYQLANAIMKSAYAQAGIETLEVVEKAIQGGPIAALGEASKKLVESVILGPPSFYEPSMAPEVLTGDGGPFADIQRNVESALKYSTKRAIKTGITGHYSNLAATKLIETHSKWVYLKLIDEAVYGSMESGYSVGKSQAMRAAEAFQAMTDARAGFEKAIKEGAFPRFANIAGNSLKETLKNAATDPKLRKLGLSVGKDIGKAKLKEVVGEWIEGSALRTYIASEAEARISTQLFLAASGVYWESYDLYQARVADRREILRQYDPKHHMQIKKDERFSNGAELSIVLRDAEGHPLPAVGHRIGVKLGGKPARLEAQDQFFFAVKAEDLQHDGKGGVALEISVEH